jgi:hypothetical protein
MTKTEFNKTLRSISTKGKLNLKKIEKLPIVVREALVFHIVRNRGPVVKELIPANFDWEWLYAMGYLHETKGKEYTFVHTCEHHIV